MKRVSDLKITTKEGFHIKNLQRFPSMEYGEDGGLKADIYYNRNLIGTLFNAGDGGCARMDFTEYGRKNLGTLKVAALSFVKRCDRDWDKYDFLKDKNASAFDDDDWEALVITIEQRYDDVKTIKQSFRKGYKSVCIISNDVERQYIAYKVDGVTLDEVLNYIKRRGLDKTYPYHSGLFLASMPEFLEVM